jgi:hypothetical protein
MFYINETNLNVLELADILQKKNIKVNFYIAGEPIIPPEIIDVLLPHSIYIFCQNNIYGHPQIRNLPIGIRDCESVVPMHRGFSHCYLYEEGLKTVEKSIMCLLCFSYTHQERHQCYNTLKDKEWVVNLNDKDFEKQLSIHCGKVPVHINYEYTHKSKYILCPSGYGVDTHRFFEVIYLDSVPIVKKTHTFFDKLYTVFPCLVVSDWSDVTKEYLEENWEQCVEKLVSFKTKYPNFFTDMNTIEEILPFL